MKPGQLLGNRNPKVREEGTLEPSMGVTGGGDRMLGAPAAGRSERGPLESRRSAK